MPIGEGAFVAFVKKVMEKGALSATDVAIRSGKQISQPALSRILSGGHTPWALKDIAGIAKGLKTDLRHLLNLAAEDWVRHVLDHYSADRAKVLRRQCDEPRKIPYVKLNDLTDVLSSDGYPDDAIERISIPWDLGPRAFAVLMQDDSMKPLVKKGHVCILAPAKRIVGEDYGLFGTKSDGLFIGRLKSDKWYYQARSGDEDFDLRSAEHRKVTFILRVQAVIRAPRWETGRKSPGPK
jgi:hypothetical protein